MTLELPADRGLVSTPLVLNGALYFIGSMNIVRAVDASSGRLLWQYDPEVYAAAGRMRAGYNRGIGFWKGKVLIGNDGTENGPSQGYVTAYGAETGKQAWRRFDRFCVFGGSRSVYVQRSPAAAQGRTGAVRCNALFGGPSSWKDHSRPGRRQPCPPVSGTVVSGCRHGRTVTNKAALDAPTRAVTATRTLDPADWPAAR